MQNLINQASHQAIEYVIEEFMANYNRDEIIEMMEDGTLESNIETQIESEIELWAPEALGPIQTFQNLITTKANTKANRKEIIENVKEYHNII